MNDRDALKEAGVMFSSDEGDSVSGSCYHQYCSCHHQLADHPIVEPFRVDDNEIESEIVAEDVDDDIEEEFNFHAMRQDDITVSPITEVTEPASDYQDYQSDAMSITPTNMMDTEPGDDYPENSPTPPPLDQQQKNMPCELK